MVMIDFFFTFSKFQPDWAICFEAKLSAVVEVARLDLARRDKAENQLNY